MGEFTPEEIANLHNDPNGNEKIVAAFNEIKQNAIDSGNEGAFGQRLQDAINSLNQQNNTDIPVNDPLNDRSSWPQNADEQAGKNILDLGYALTRKEEEAQNGQPAGAEGEGRNNKSNKKDFINYGEGSYDNNYERYQNNPGSDEAITNAFTETDPTKFNQGANGPLSIRFTDAVVELRAKAEANLTRQDREDIGNLKAQIAENTKLLNSKSLSAGDQLLLTSQIEQAKLKINLIKYNKESVLPAGNVDSKNYQDVINMLGDNKITSNQLGASTAGAICYVAVHTNYMGKDPVEFWAQQAAAGNVGITNQKYRGLYAPALGKGSGWSEDGMINVQNKTNGYYLPSNNPDPKKWTFIEGKGGIIPVSSSDVDTLNNSKANTALAWVDTDNDGVANHYVRIVRGPNGNWYNFDHNRSGDLINRPAYVNFNNVYGLEYNPKSSK
ncbi:large structural domain protein [Leptospira inadai serovar Lyme str. 10]|uniref:Large structural domain protein n=2 Tax=Leptospira inadai serovar Lyme TaxID=293084 RepID=V6HU17_9LEPT|nr:TIGR04388 family protein [Leptospira inadai]EQA36234.1 large structural domain protein [Leptospira inadai serovar Lyme str. 10]